MDTNPPGNNILSLVPGTPAEDIPHPPDEVLEDCKGKYDTLMVMGWDTEGNLMVRSSGNLTVFDAGFIAQRVLHLLHSGAFDNLDD